MRNRAIILLLMLLPLGVPSAQAEEVDRALASAAGKAITWGAALDEANAERLLSGELPLQLRLEETGAVDQVRDAVERLADRLVVIKAWERSALATDSGDELRGRADALWSKFAEQYTSANALQDALIRYGLSEAALRKRFLLQQQVFDFSEYSLRPQAKADGERAAAYYRDEFLPSFRQEQPSADPPDLEQVRQRIEEILVQKDMSRLTGPWLQGLRKEHGFRLISPQPAEAR